MAGADRPDTASIPTPSYTLRVTFAYKGGVVRFAGSQRVAMTTPPSSTPAPEKERSGYWFEARDANGALLFLRVLHDPVRADVEVHSKDSKQSSTRIPIAEPEGRFEVLVPDLSEARSLHLFGTPVGVRSHNAPSQEILRLDFDEARRAEPGKVVSGAPPRDPEGN